MRNGLKWQLTEKEEAEKLQNSSSLRSTHTSETLTQVYVFLLKKHTNSAYYLTGTILIAL